jgi:hypothetical protein
MGRRLFGRRRRGAPGPRHRLAGIAAALAIGLGSAGCAGEAPPPGRVLLVGIDGATLRVVGPMLEAGRLPHLRAVAEGGASGPLQSIFPLLSPRVWTSVATGRQPPEHGIEGWVRTGPSGQPQLYDSRDRKAHALWNIASDAGLSVGVVSWLITHPPERVRGVMVSDHVVPGALEGRIALARQFVEQQRPGMGPQLTAPEGMVPSVYPEHFGERVAALRAIRDPLVSDARLREAMAKLDPDWEFPFAKLLEADELVMRIALAVEAEQRPDLLMVYLQGIDRLSHFFWFGMEPAEAYPSDQRRPEAERELARELLEAYYEVTDALLGMLLERFGDEDLVMVMSDHGFEARIRGDGLTGTHDTAAARDGVLFARGRGIAPGARVEGTGVLDIAPTVLAWLGLPVARDMPGRIAPFAEVPAPGWVASYDGRPIERIGGSDSGVEDAIVEQLRELGYVE